MVDLSHSFSVNVYRLPGTSHSFDEPAISQGAAEFPHLANCWVSHSSPDDYFELHKLYIPWKSYSEIL